VLALVYLIDFSGFVWHSPYLLSLIDPRDEIVLQTELEDHCDKLAVDRLSSDIIIAHLT